MNAILALLLQGAIGAAATSAATSSSNQGGDKGLSPDVLALLAALVQNSSQQTPPTVKVPWAITAITIAWMAVFAVMGIIRAFKGADAGLDFALGIFAAGSILSLGYWVSSTFGSFYKTATFGSGAQGGVLPIPAPIPTPAPDAGIGKPGTVTETPPAAGVDTLLISDAAVDLIVGFEVTSRAVYESKYATPTWPGGSSGVTIGIGYDIGAGVSTPAKLWADWRGLLPDNAISALERCIGVTGSAAKGLITGAVAAVYVPWDSAIKVYRNINIPEECAKCVKYLPHFDELSPDSRGALVSLVFNRGPSFNMKDDRYREMRAIKAHMEAREFGKIPDEIRSMKRLWVGQGLDGILKRRDAEADLFERGLGPTGDVGKPAGADLVRFAEKYVGRPYRNIVVPKDDADWSGAFDCAELASFVIFQVLHILYGCINNSVEPRVADAWTGSWKRDAIAIGRMVSVDRAVKTPGAFLLRYPPSGGGMGHIAISMGDGRVVEAYSSTKGVIIGTAAGRRWDTGVEVGDAVYVMSGSAAAAPPVTIYAEGQPNMDPAKVREIQTALAAAGFSPGEIDGQYGSNTTTAVGFFQRDRGLLVDGEVGPLTANAMGVAL